MALPNNSVSQHFAFFLWLIASTASADHDNQPKIIVQNGDLILEAAYDQNISLRLSRDSALLLNNIDVMAKMQRFLTPASSGDFDSHRRAEEIQDQVHQLKDYIDKLSLSLSVMQNRTRRMLPLRELRQHLGKIRRLTGVLKVLDQNIAKDECTEVQQPCKNGGTCIDLYRRFYCFCPDGWTGSMCEEDVDECYLYAGTGLGCQNEAVCVNMPGSYNCECAKGFSGTRCRLRSSVCHQYESAALCGHGTCVPSKNPHGYTCVCDQGWTQDSNADANSTASLTCRIDVDECEQQRNPCYNECINLPGGFKCGPCPVGYTGNGVTCMDINECETNNGGCSLLPKVRCINTEGSYRCGACPVGWVGDGRTCNLATSNSCDSEMVCHPQAKCEYVSNVATCTCPHGMFGHGFGPNGCHTRVINDPCENHICQNNATCFAMGRTTSCLCPEGYFGSLCETADACHPSPCENGGKCKALSNNTYKCICTRGNTGKHCEVLRNICHSIVRNSTGELTYPSDGASQYASNERCNWVIQTTRENILNVTFTSFDVQDDLECNKDWLQIHDGSSFSNQLIGRFCGKRLPRSGNILSSQHQLLFSFRSDNASNYPGFRMTWQSQPYVCGDILTLGYADDGIIRSPGSPGKTPANRECEWSLSAPYGFRFVIRLYEVSMGMLANCTGDSLKVYDADVLVQEFCESSHPVPFKTTSNKLKLHLHTDSSAADTSFQLHYEVTSSVPHCGGVFTEPSGVIVEPMVASNCLYLIQQPLGTQIRLEFLEMQLAPTDMCDRKNIKIFDGDSDEDPLRQMSCFDQMPAPVVSTSNNMLLSYTRQLENNKDSPFRAKYTRVCATSYSGPDAGEFATLNYPKAYAENITCWYHIYAPDGNVIHANFTDFSLAQSQSSSDTDLSKETSLGSQQDESSTYVDIHLSSIDKRRYYSGAPMAVVSVHNKMSIVFHATTNPAKARGFRVRYTFEKLPHGGGVFTKNKGHITRKNYGDDSQYIIEAPQGQHIRFLADVKIFQTTDSLLIYGNATGGRDYLLKNITASEKVNEVFHFNVMTIFVSQFATWSDEAYYEFVSSAEACGGNFTEPYGEIKSPNWPDIYAPDLDCVWIISAGLGKQVELIVHDFRLDEDCLKGDVLEIRNGVFANSPLIGRFCADQVPSRIPSLTNNLYLRFTTNSIRQGAGFRLTWEQTGIGCGGKLTSYKGSIHSPHSMASNPDETTSDVTCAWHIFVVQGSSVALTVTPSIDALEFCRSNSLLVYDGSADARHLLHFNCSQAGNDGVLKFFSSTNEVLVLFSPTLMNDIHFILDYETNCHTMLDQVQGVIESPDFTDSLDCKWVIRAGAKKKVKLHFSHLRLHNLDMACSSDYIEVLDMMNEQILQRYQPCREIPPPIISNGDHLIVHFVTGSGKGKSSFRTEYLQEGCGEIITHDAGIFYSPKYPYSVDLDCEWYFKAPAGKQIVLDIRELKIDVPSADCDVDVLLVKEHKNSARLLLRECSTEEERLTTITSPTNELYMRFLTGPNKVRKYFKAAYKIIDARCGGIIRARSGAITSPNYPLNLTKEYNCKWEIIVPNSYGIVLNFTDIHMNAMPDCRESALRISTVKKNNESLWKTFCSSATGLVLDVPFSHLVVEYTNGGQQGWGKFAMDFSKQCGGEISRDSGYIRSQSTESCIWSFNVPEGTLISLSIYRLECFCRSDEVAEKKCTNGLGFKYTKDTESSTNYTNFYCEDHLSTLTFEAPELYVHAKGVNFRAEYSTIKHACGGIVKSPRGTLVSPAYPLTYPPNTECFWFLQGTKGSHLEVQIYEMDIAESAHCNADYLEIANSESVLGIYCGKTLPDEVIASENINVLFHSSSESTGKGFKLKWSYAHLTEVVNRTKGVIEAPPPDMVRNEEEPYAWRIMVPRQQFIALNFVRFIAGLNLFDGFDDTAMPVEMSPSPWRFVSSSNVVYLKTDNANVQHFVLRWNTESSKPKIDANVNVSTCHYEGFIRSQNADTFWSAGYPHGYEPNMHCVWIFKPEEVTDHVVLKLQSIDLEETGGCSADYVTISTSTDLVQWHEMDKICNKSVEYPSPFKLYRGSPNIKLDFVSDDSINRTGVRFIMTTKCGSNLTESVGFIPGDNLGDFETNCLWRVSVKPNTRIGIELNFPNTKTIDRNSCEEFIMIHDGIDEYAPLLPPGKICVPQNATDMQVNSTHNYLTIKYYLTPRMGLISKRWNLTYRAYSQCNEEYRLIAEAPSVNITSPNYPHVPHPHTECEWRIVAPVGEVIQVEFDDPFDMSTRHCSSEFLEMFDGSTSLARSLGRFCKRPPLITTTQRVLYMHYLTDVNEPRSGFKARISISKCGGYFSNTDGVIMSPGYPKLGGYPASSQCDYAIRLPKGYSIAILAEDVHLPFDVIHPKSKDFLELIPMEEEKYNEHDHLFIYGNTTKGTKFDLNVNRVVVRFHTFFKNMDHRGFKLKFYGLEGHCQQTVTGDSGYLTLHLSPERYDNEIERGARNCEWRITAPKGQRVRLSFTNLNNFKDQNLTAYPKFSIFNDPECESKQLEFDVGSYDPHTVMQSSDNIMVVKIYVPAVDYHFGTVRAEYTSSEETSCPPTINADNPSGLIDIRHTQPAFVGQYYCGISIVLSGGETLAFNINSLEVVQNATNTKKMSSPLMFWNDDTPFEYQENSTNILQVLTAKKASVPIVQSSKWRILRLTMDYRIHKCGGYFNVQSTAMHFHLPNVTDIGYGPIVCVWSLRRHAYWSKNSISKVQISGNFSFTDSCELEFVLVKVGESSDVGANTKICRDNGVQLRNYDLQNLQTQVIYQSHNFKYQSSQLSIDVQPQIDCGRNIEVQRGNVILEMSAEEYKNNQECVWEFNTAPGLYMKFQLLGHSFIEDSPNCTNDYLEFQRNDAGFWIPDARYCGRIPQLSYNTTTPLMRVIWRTNAAVTARGFALFVQRHCWVALNVTTSVQYLESPAEGFTGDNPIQCSYVFQSNEPEKLIRVKTTYHGDCDRNMFTVYKRDGSGVETHESHCESELQQMARKYLRYRFNVFKAQLYTIEYVLDTCGGNITTSRTIIRPIGQELSNLYDNSMDCAWFVTAPADHSILVRFKYFETHDKGDYVNIYSGHGMESAKRVAKLYGDLNDSPPVIMVDDNRAIVNAVSDLYAAAKGFEAEIVFLHNCNERIALAEGTSPITLTRNFELNEEEEYMCVYHIKSPKGYRVGIEIKRIQINKSLCPAANGTCQDACNTIEVFDSIAAKQSAIGRYCVTPLANTSLISSYEDAMLRFSATQSGNWKFEIILRIEQSICGEITKTETEGNQIFKFTFPPNGEVSSYGPNIHCKWRLSLQHAMELHFTYIDLQNASQITGKCGDYIQIKEGYATSKYCGHATNLTTNVMQAYGDNPFVSITFHSDESVEGKGFQFVASRFMRCNRTYVQANGVVEYESSVSDGPACINRIVVPDNYSLNLYVTGLALRRSDCRKRTNKILDLKNGTVVFDTCGSHEVRRMNVFTHTNDVQLEFMDYVSIYYNTAPANATPGCGGTWKILNGFFTSPPYNNDRNYSKCRWTILVPAPTVIRIFFYDFDMGSPSNCHLDNVEIREIYPDGSEIILQRLCGSEMPLDIKSATNHLVIVSRKSPNFDGVGWSLMYDAVVTLETEQDNE